MDKKINELSLTEIQNVAGGARRVPSASVSVNAPAMVKPTAPVIQPSRFEAMMARM